MLNVLIDTFIAWFMRRKAGSYLKFEEMGTIAPPPPPPNPIHLYIHIPFCARLCPYCSFHRVAFNETTTRAYFQALRQELRLYHDLGFRFSEVYIGGGTPTILMEELVETLTVLHHLFAPRNISVETNPDRLDRGTLSRLAEHGVGRVSVGVQTFDDAILKLIGRYEKYGSGMELQDKIRDVLGIVQTLNIDMIYNFPVQTQAQLLNDLTILEAIKPDQITFYPLMVSDATLHDMTAIMGRHSFIKERRFYELITRHLAPSYRHGSAWCFSRDAGMIDEYIVSHDEYIGAGSGAFGLVNGAIFANTFSIPDYIQTLSRGQLPLQAHKVFTAGELARYTFLMDLFGLQLDRARFKAKFGADVWRRLPLECLFFTLIGALASDGASLRVTARGRYYWVIMMREFFTGVDNFRDLSRVSAGMELGR